MHEENLGLQQNLAQEEKLGRKGLSKLIIPDRSRDRTPTSSPAAISSVIPVALPAAARTSSTVAPIFSPVPILASDVIPASNRTSAPLVFVGVQVPTQNSAAISGLVRTPASVSFSSSTSAPTAATIAVTTSIPTPPARGIQAPASALVPAYIPIPTTIDAYFIHQRTMSASRIAIEWQRLFAGIPTSPALRQCNTIIPIKWEYELYRYADGYFTQPLIKRLLDLYFSEHLSAWLAGIITDGVLAVSFKKAQEEGEYKESYKNFPSALLISIITTLRIMKAEKPFKHLHTDFFALIFKSFNIFFSKNNIQFEMFQMMFEEHLPEECWTRLILFQANVNLRNKFLRWYKVNFEDTQLAVRCASSQAQREEELFDREGAYIASFVKLAAIAKELPQQKKPQIPIARVPTSNQMSFVAPSRSQQSMGPEADMVSVVAGMEQLSLGPTHLTYNQRMQQGDRFNSSVLEEKHIPPASMAYSGMPQSHTHRFIMPYTVASVGYSYTTGPSPHLSHPTTYSYPTSVSFAATPGSGSSYIAPGLAHAYSHPAHLGYSHSSLVQTPPSRLRRDRPQNQNNFSGMGANLRSGWNPGVYYRPELHPVHSQQHGAGASHQHTAGEQNRFARRG